MLIVICALIVGGAIFGICAGAIASTATHDGLKTVVIDAGHGGIDAGVLGVSTKTKESEINLYIAKYLRGYFADAGFNAVLTRSTQGGLYGTTTKGFKMRDMKKRKEIIEKNNADMVISIHQNYCPVPSRRGATVFYDKGSESGKAFAESIQRSLNAMDGCVTQNSPLVGDYYMLKCTSNPSALVECGFLSNTLDEKLLITAEYQKAVAYAIFKGAVSFYT